MQGKHKRTVAWIGLVGACALGGCTTYMEEETPPGRVPQAPRHMDAPPTEGGWGEQRSEGRATETCIHGYAVNLRAHTTPSPQKCAAGLRIVG